MLASHARQRTRSPWLHIVGSHFQRLLESAIRSTLAVQLHSTATTLVSLTRQLVETTALAVPQPVDVYAGALSRLAAMTHASLRSRQAPVCEKLLRTIDSLASQWATSISAQLTNDGALTADASTSAVRSRVSGMVREFVMSLCNGAVQAEFEHLYRFLVTVGQHVASEAAASASHPSGRAAVSQMGAALEPRALQHAVRTVPHLLAQATAQQDHGSVSSGKANASSTPTAGAGADEEEEDGEGGALGVVGTLGTVLRSAAASLLQLGVGGGSAAVVTDDDIAAATLHRQVRTEVMACINACCNVLPGALAGWWLLVCGRLLLTCMYVWWWRRGACDVAVLAGHLVDAAASSIDDALHHFVDVMYSAAGTSPKKLPADANLQCYHVCPPRSNDSQSWLWCLICVCRVVGQACDLHLHCIAVADEVSTVPEPAITRDLLPTRATGEGPTNRGGTVSAARFDGRDCVVWQPHPDSDALEAWRAAICMVHLLVYVCTGDVAA